MDKLDEMIAEALKNEDQEILTETEELGYFAQALGIFRGPQGWISWVVMLVQIGLFGVGAWAAWQFFHTTDTLTALKWGLPAAILLLAAMMLKLSLMPVMQADRVIRQIKRLELLLARKSD
ncbi:MAG TPA: hypothetical protein ENK63_00970 [Rhodobacterales bacterium]|nr:hypothetical protein [Rhodobacterales bacterium]